VDQTFARCHRLTRTDEFSSVFGFRRAIRGKLLTVHYQPRPDGENGARLGLVIAKKYLKRAVDRNHFKRIIREQFRCVRGGLPALDLVVRLTVKSAAIDPKLLTAELIFLLNRVQQSRPGVEQ
jgi:ribonuclease P protein component